MASISQSPCMDQETLEKYRKAIGELETAFDRKTALFDSIPQNINPLHKIAKESKRVTDIRLHSPGEIIEMSDGRKYQVQDDGKWLRV